MGCTIEVAKWGVQSGLQSDVHSSVQSEVHSSVQSGVLSGVLRMTSELLDHFVLWKNNYFLKGHTKRYTIVLCIFIGVQIQAHTLIRMTWWFLSLNFGVPFGVPFIIFQCIVSTGLTTNPCLVTLELLDHCVWQKNIYFFKRAHQKVHQHFQIKDIQQLPLFIGHIFLGKASLYLLNFGFSKLEICW